MNGAKFVKRWLLRIQTREWAADASQVLVSMITDWVKSSPAAG